jgi:protein TonB
MTRARSLCGAAVALAVSGVLHAAGLVATGPRADQVALEGGGSETAALGAAFEDFAAGAIPVVAQTTAAAALGSATASERQRAPAAETVQAQVPAQESSPVPVPASASVPVPVPAVSAAADLAVPVAMRPAPPAAAAVSHPVSPATAPPVRSQLATTRPHVAAADGARAEPSVTSAAAVPLSPAAAPPETLAASSDLAPTAAPRPPARPEERRVQASRSQPTRQDSTVAPAAPPRPAGNAATDARRGSATGQAGARAAASGGGAESAGRDGNAAASNYPGEVLRQITRLRRPRAPERGTVVVAFRIDRYGALAAVSVARSSGSAALDGVALNHIRRAAPFPPPPVGAETTFTFEFVAMR